MIFKKEKKENNTIKSLIVVFAIIVTFTCGYLLGLYSDDNISRKRIIIREKFKKSRLKIHIGERRNT